MRLPRISFTRASDALSSSSPLKRTLPLTRAFEASSPSMLRSIWLLPEPDSPTMASTSPADKSRSTPDTARTTPPPLRNSTVRLRASSKGAWAISALFLRVQRVAQTVAQVIQAVDNQGQENGGN